MKFEVLEMVLAYSDMVTIFLIQLSEYVLNGKLVLQRLSFFLAPSRKRKQSLF